MHRLLYLDALGIDFGCREQKLARDSERAKRDADRFAEEQAKQEAQEEEVRKKREEERLRRETERKARKEERRRLAAEEDKQREMEVNKEKKRAGRRTKSDVNTVGNYHDQTCDNPDSARQVGESPGVTKIGPPNQPFYPEGNDRARLLGFAQFDDELLRNIQDLNVRVLQNAAWRPNCDGELSGGFSYVERASWNDQDIAVKFLKRAQTDSGIARGKKVSECIQVCHKLD